MGIEYSGWWVVMSIQRLSLVYKSDYMTLKLNQELMDCFLRPVEHDVGVWVGGLDSKITKSINVKFMKYLPQNKKTKSFTCYPDINKGLKAT